MKRFKNNKLEADTWVGMQIEPGAYYEIQTIELIKWQNDSKVLTDIATGAALMNDGVTDILDVANAINFLKNKDAREVVTQLEKNDKILRTIWAMAVTDTNGIARVAIKVPDSGRYVAYGDAEFEEREFGDVVCKLELSDLDRLIAWQIALSIDPEATGPVADEVVRENGYPLYPTLGHYDERSLDTNAPNTSGTMGGGMAMTFAYGNTEAQTVGGYGHLPGGFYFVIEGKKATPVAGKKFQVSIDWAEPS